MEGYTVYFRLVVIPARHDEVIRFLALDGGRKRAGKKTAAIRLAKKNPTSGSWTRHDDPTQVCIFEKTLYKETIYVLPETRSSESIGRRE